MKIEVTSSPLKKDLTTISEGIKSFNQEHLSDEVVFEPDTNFAVFAKDESGTINIDTHH
ncbi:hypothetical protein [Shewanella youngdeokensis]|uniref:Uncharacterized protein n=1 Tax=Shewanella youngdeokensis TaxID=2999068 RepID=A0ABZ0JUJ5_9GAMM|nr:hypothetical protein RGE70_11615 [Shewanella sp. DAU334]